MAMSVPDPQTPLPGIPAQVAVVTGDVMPGMAAIAVVLLFAGWFYLLYRFHQSLHDIDPVLSAEIGKPSLFWTAFNGNVRLVTLAVRRDIGSTRYAPLEGKARVLRAWAVLLLAALAWLLWACVRAPGV